MNWKRRKKLNHIAKSHGYDHYYLYKRHMKFSCKVKPKLEKFFATRKPEQDKPYYMFYSSVKRKHFCDLDLDKPNSMICWW